MKGIELKEDMAFERKNWWAQRIAWVVLYLFLLAGFIGFFGHGGVSSKTLRSEEKGVEIKYEHFLRLHAQDKIKISFHPNKPIKDKFSCWISSDFLDNVAIKDINPRPESTEVTEGGVLYTFKVKDVISSHSLTIYFEPEAVGSIKNSISVAGTPVLEFSHFVYP